MIKDLQGKLKSQWDTFTTSEQKLASYLLQNISTIPFETATSVGKRVGVSAMTVGRFLRTLGYAGLNELKDELRGDTPWMQLYKNPDQPTNGDFVSECLQNDIRVLTNAYALARTDEWRAIVNMLVKAERVSVTSFHHGRFIGLGFANLLQHIKPCTRFSEGGDGTYADLLLDSNEGSCVVLIEFRRYSRHSRILAEELAARGIPLAIITDTQCYWARQLTDNVLMLPIDPDRTWHNFGAVTSLLSLLITAVTQAQGENFERIAEITQLRQKFVGYDEAPPGPKNAARKKGAKAVKEKATGKREAGAKVRPRSGKAKT